MTAKRTVTRLSDINIVSAIGCSYTRPEIVDEAKKELEELKRLAAIGRDYEYLSNHEEIAGLPTVENIQRLANRRRAKEGAE